MTDCVFCKIVAGELPSYKIAEDERAFAFLDINPVHTGHTLVIPKVHAPTIFDISSEDWAAVTELVRRLAPVVDAAVEGDGVNILMNNREHAGQVVHHAHVHIIPRFTGDGLTHWPHRKYKEGEAEEVQKRILAAF